MLRSYPLQTFFGEITVVDGQGATGRVNLIFMVIKRGELRKVTGIIKPYRPQSFYSVEDVRQVSRGVFPAETPG
jgi:uncharacterized membrane-anchored protein YitT (DUF2179 family)